MAIPVDTLMEESKCYLCLGNISQAQAMIMALLNRIAAGGSGDGGALVYRALLTQSGTNPPVATVLQNTIGSIVWTRNNAGIYTGTLANAFTANKTMVFFQASIDAQNANLNSGWWGTASTIQVKSGDTSGALSDGLLVTVPIEILVYP